MYSQTKLEALEALRLNSDEHRYSYKGLSIPSVTQVIDALLPFRGMPPEILQSYRDRGNAVHQATARIDKRNDTFKSVSSILPEEWICYVLAWDAFKKVTGFESVDIEVRLFNRKHLYAGTADRVGILDGRLVVVDLKTGAMYPEYALQTAAYREAFNEGWKGEKVQGRYAVQLQADGKFAVEEHKDKSDFATFLAALHLDNWKARHGK